MSKPNHIAIGAAILAALSPAYAKAPFPQRMTGLTVSGTVTAVTGRFPFRAVVGQPYSAIFLVDTSEPGEPVDGCYEQPSTWAVVLKVGTHVTAYQMGGALTTCPDGTSSVYGLTNPPPITVGTDFATLDARYGTATLAGDVASRGQIPAPPARLWFLRSLSESYGGRFVWTIRLAQTYYAAGDIQASCAQLDAYLAALDGTYLTAKVYELQTAAHAAETAIGCTP